MPFSSIARFYDIDDGRLSADIPFHLSFARKTGGPILDLGVGSARLALPLAQAGFQVTGVDISSEMLDLARKRIARAGLQDRIHLLQANFLDVPLSGPFALAYCGFNSFLHIIEADEEYRAISGWRLLLRPGGLLVIDVENPQLENLMGLTGQWELEEELLDPDTMQCVRKYTAAWVDLADQVLYLRRKYETNDKIWQASFEVRILFQRELSMLLACSHFDNLRFYGDYDFTPWHPTSPRLIAVAEATRGLF